MSVVVVDARDSFVHIVAECFRKEGVETQVVRPDLEDVTRRLAQEQPDALVLGPGPGHPAESCHMPILRDYLGTLPILGVCLGHQALGLCAGWRVARAPQPRHGKRSAIEHGGAGLFDRINSPMHVARYHSLVVEPPETPSSNQVVARSLDDGVVMAMADPVRQAWGVQFHPESYGTTAGQQLIANFCRMVGLAPPAEQDVVLNQERVA